MLSKVQQDVSSARHNPRLPNRGFRCYALGLRYTLYVQRQIPMLLFFRGSLVVLRIFCQTVFVALYVRSLRVSHVIREAQHSSWFCRIGYKLYLLSFLVEHLVLLKLMYAL